MKLIQNLSAHRFNGWRGQYDRMIRWFEKFKQISNSEKEAETHSHDYFDIMYVCFQNIFFLKDWLKSDTNISNSELNVFIKSNIEIGICRDICNGTKHFEINHESVDSEFGFIKSFNPMSKINMQEKFEILVCIDGKNYNPEKLMEKCIQLWDNFISEKLNIIKVPSR